jgi:TPP-dependent pyruvate/acetoin dehydrogenase alpha subunit
LLKELERKKEKDKIEKMRQELDDAYLEELEEARSKPLPKVVQAYKNIFGFLPEGFLQ